MTWKYCKSQERPLPMMSEYVQDNKSLLKLNKFSKLGQSDGCINHANLYLHRNILFLIQKIENPRTNAISFRTPDCLFRMCPFCIVLIIPISYNVAFTYLNDLKLCRYPSSLLSAAWSFQLGCFGTFFVDMGDGIRLWIM